MEELQARHRREQRDLQSRITQKTRNATKKTRRGVNDECKTLERELKERQQTELDAVRGGEAASGLEALDLHSEDEPVALPSGDERRPNDDTAATKHFPARASSPILSTTSPITSAGTNKRNRQKERLARRAAEQDAAIIAAELEAAHMPDQRKRELKSMADQREKLRLDETAIRPDGHCLYSAIATSLPAETVKASGPYGSAYQNVRYVAAEFISTHAEDFAAFLEEPVDAYTKKIKDTSEWGGAVELQALARAYERRINVLQSDGRIERIGNGKDGEDEIWLAYYRHSFGLGEHYNALRRKKE